MAETFQTAKCYVAQTPEGVWRIAGTRVTMDSIIYAFQQGETPEQIVQAFPTLSLEQVYVAIAHYLHDHEEFDAYLGRQEQHLAELRQATEERNHDLRERILGRWEKLKAKESAS